MTSSSRIAFIVLLVLFGVFQLILSISGNLFTEYDNEVSIGILALGSLIIFNVSQFEKG